MKIEQLGTVQHRAFTLTPQVRAAGDEEKTYHALAYGYYDGTPETIDTYGTTMAPGAFAHVTTDDFRILEYHNSGTDPVGKPVAVADGGDGLGVDFVLAPTDRGAELGTLIDNGFIRGVSVGFTPLDGYKMKDGTIVFTKCDLHELSLVNCPSSKKALITLSRELGIDQRKLEEVYADVVREATPAEELRDALVQLAPVLEQRDVTDPTDPKATVATVLQLVSVADTAVDIVMQMLSELLNVENPDESQDAILDAGEEESADTDEEAELGSALELAARVEVRTRKLARVSDNRRRRR